MGGFSQSTVEANGPRVRYAEAGHGVALVHLQPPGDLHLTPAHDLLARRFRVVVMESPGSDAAATGVVVAALAALGVETFNLLGSATRAEAALRLARQAPARGRA